MANNPNGSRGLHVVSSDEADLIHRRQDALLAFQLHYQRSNSRDTMSQALEAAVRAFSHGARRPDTFEWEFLNNTVNMMEFSRAVCTSAHSRTGETIMPNTARKIMSAVRVMARCSKGAGLISRAQLDDVLSAPLPAAHDTEAGRLILHEDLRKLLDNCGDDPNHVKGVRDAFALLGLASTGARREEFVCIQVGSVDPVTGSAELVVTKGGEPRTVHFQAQARQALEAWLQIRGTDPGPLLRPLRKGGGIDRTKGLSALQLWKMVRRRCEAVGLPRTTPHDFRRFLVTTLLSEGTDIVLVGKIVGHKSIETTRRYDRRGEREQGAAVELLQLPTPRSRRPAPA